MDQPHSDPDPKVLAHVRVLRLMIQAGWLKGWVRRGDLGGFMFTDAGHSAAEALEHAFHDLGRRLTAEELHALLDMIRLRLHHPHRPENGGISHDGDAG